MSKQVFRIQGFDSQGCVRVNCRLSRIQRQGRLQQGPHQLESLPELHRDGKLYEIRYNSILLSKMAVFQVRHNFGSFTFIHLLCSLLLGTVLPGSVQVLAAEAEEGFGCIAGDCENGRGTLVSMTERGQTTYRGTFRNGEYDGFGRLSYDDERAVYKGYWRAGKRNGRGTYWDRENNVYIGQWRNGRRHGHGVQAFRVEGWTEDAYTERGLQDNSENYTGNFRNDVFYGEGTYRWADGTKYVGNWAANKMHGEGQFEYANGFIAKRRYEFGERIMELGF